MLHIHIRQTDRQTDNSKLQTTEFHTRSTYYCYHGFLLGKKFHFDTLDITVKVILIIAAIHMKLNKY